MARPTPPPAPLPRAPASVPLPAGFRLVADRSTRVLDGGRALVGGTPLRLVRLGPEAARLAATWLHGEPVEGSERARLVARRLVAAGIVHPRPGGPGPAEEQVTVVVPVRDRPAQLERLLRALGRLQVVVVDDASAEPELVRRVAARAGARFLALGHRSGPAGARNAGLAMARSELVAFVDSDCTPCPGWLGPLLAHFDDPLVAAVAPRVVAGPPTGRDWLDRYELARSPLDRGPHEGVVAPGSAVHFVPAAALVVRRAAAGQRCFDESLARGEDVDFVWRLANAGWSVRYVPASRVLHEPRSTLGGWLAQRAGYGASTGPLARRYGRSLAPASVPGWTAGALGLAAWRRPAGALAVTGGATALLARRLATVIDHPVREAARLTVPGTVRAALPLWGGSIRTLAPAALLALASRRLRRAGAAALFVPAVADWVVARPALDPVRYALCHVADDLAHACGIWAGCVAARTLRPALPSLSFTTVTRHGSPRPAEAPPGRR